MAHSLASLRDEAPSAQSFGRPRLKAGRREVVEVENSILRRREGSCQSCERWRLEARLHLVQSRLQVDAKEGVMLHYRVIPPEEMCFRQRNNACLVRVCSQHTEHEYS
jgi:hypothetical protein